MSRWVPYVHSKHVKSCNVSVYEATKAAQCCLISPFCLCPKKLYRLQVGSKPVNWAKARSVDNSHVMKYMLRLNTCRIPSPIHMKHLHSMVLKMWLHALACCHLTGVCTMNEGWHYYDSSSINYPLFIHYSWDENYHYTFFLLLIIISIIIGISPIITNVTIIKLLSITIYLEAPLQNKELWETHRRLALHPGGKCLERHRHISQVTYHPVIKRGWLE